MPRAIVDTTPQRFELKSCPPDGYVELKRMSYDKWLHRTDISLSMQIEMEERKQRRNKRTTPKGSGGSHAEMQLQNRAVTSYEFTNCIVGHNLEDENGNTLDLTNPSTLDRLDPQVGNEIGDLIKELHEPISEEEEGNF